MRWVNLFLLAIVTSMLPLQAETASSARSQSVVSTWTPPLKAALAEKQLSLGAPVFFRITKTQSQTDRSGKLEAFVKTQSGAFKAFKSWDICTYSGALGPKLKEGDGQSPEGFYFVTVGRLNPYSSFHLSFNLGYPNTYDRAHGRTGSYLMVHGKCVSIGCYAMTDDGIEEIYTLLESALKNGQPFVRVHIFPFPMTEANLASHADNPNANFWENLTTGWNWFEEKGYPPNVNVENMRYVFSESRP